ncbi:MAG TPA: hypothetical protein VIL58_00165 [Thermoplasmata archaeon]
MRVRALATILSSTVLVPLALLLVSATLALLIRWPIDQVLPEGLFWGGLAILAFTWITATPFGNHAFIATLSTLYHRTIDLDRRTTPTEAGLLVVGSAGGLASMALAPVLGSSELLFAVSLAAIGGAAVVALAWDVVRNRKRRGISRVSHFPP